MPRTADVPSSVVDWARENTRSYGENADHHIWNNNGTLWCHYTIHVANDTKRRIHCSLKKQRIVKPLACCGTTS